MDIESLNKLLPSQAKQTLTEFFLKKLEGAKLNCYAEPTYNFANALHDVKTAPGSYIGGILAECFEAALKEYNRKHPKCWNNDKQEAFRK